MFHGSHGTALKNFITIDIGYMGPVLENEVCVIIRDYMMFVFFWMPSFWYPNLSKKNQRGHR